MNVKRENETDQSKLLTSLGMAILIGQFGFLFYVLHSWDKQSEIDGTLMIDCRGTQAKEENEEKKDREKRKREKRRKKKVSTEGFELVIFCL